MLRMPAGSKSQPSLFTRLGGQEGVTTVLDDFVVRMTTHPQVARFFAGLDSSAGSKFRSQLVDFICAAAGGNSAYRGRDMSSAHRTLNISDSDWEVTVAHLRASLQQAQVPEREIQELVEIIGPLKKQIVQRP